VLVDAIRIKQEATHDTITRAKAQQVHAHHFAESVRRKPQRNQLATSFIPHGVLPRAIHQQPTTSQQVIERGLRMKQLHATLHSLVNDYFIKLYRVERFNHRTTPLVTWQVWIESDSTKPSLLKSCVRECDTKREAITWVSIYNQPAKEHA
jgi:hypothetical protein